MKIRRYFENDACVAGVTMKDPTEPEACNMALHTCDKAEHIIENRRKLAALLNIGLDAFVCANQCHSANFHEAASEDRGRGAIGTGNAIPDTDALYTFKPGLLLCCFTADCVPVILCDEAAGLIAAIHSGWEGTAKEITPKVLDHLIKSKHCRESDIRVAMGPAISQERFEVDRDVYDRFKSLGYADDFISYNSQTDKYHIDNQMVVKRQCELQGIPSGHISVDRTCTFNSPEGFSYRQDKTCGRHLSFIIRKR